VSVYTNETREHWTDLHEIFHRGVSLKYILKSQLWLQSDNNSGHSTCTSACISCVTSQTQVLYGFWRWCIAHRISGFLEYRTIEGVQKPSNSVCSLTQVLWTKHFLCKLSWANAPKLIQVLRIQKLEQKSITPSLQQQIYMGVTEENKTRIAAAEIKCMSTYECSWMTIKEMRDIMQEMKQRPHRKHFKL
jgi:hypothetical protein